MTGEPVTGTISVQGTNADVLSDGQLPSGINPRWTATSLSNTGVFRPYSYLMVYSYGLASTSTRTTEKAILRTRRVSAGGWIMRLQRT